MIISFFGHSDFYQNPTDTETILNKLENLYIDNKIDFYLGGYGRFDGFALSLCKKFKQTHKNCKIFYITPYLDNHLASRKDYLEKNFDEIIYPPIEQTPKRFAISKRNEWIINQSDFIIFYVWKGYGGAYNSYKQAKRKNKPFINLCSEFDK